MITIGKNSQSVLSTYSMNTQLIILEVVKYIVVDFSLIDKYKVKSKKQILKINNDEICFKFYCNKSNISYFKTGYDIEHDPIHLSYIAGFIARIAHEMNPKNVVVWSPDLTFSNQTTNTISKRSKDNINQTVKPLQYLFLDSMKHCPIDTTVICGARSTNEQMELYKKGRSFINNKWVVTDKSKIVTSVDGVYKKSKHNTDLINKYSQAVDIICSVQNQTWNISYLSFVGGWIMSAAKTKSKTYGAEFRWGLNWDRDSILRFDQNLVDAPHYETIKIF